MHRKDQQNGARADFGVAHFGIKFREDCSLLIEGLWRYRKSVLIGLLALAVVDGIEVLPPLFLKRAVEFVVHRESVQVLGLVVAGYLATTLIQSACRYLWRMYLIRSSVFAGRDLRERFTQHLFSLGAGFYDRTSLGELMNLATTDVEAVRMAIGTGLLVLADSLFYLTAVPLVMVTLSPLLTLLVCLPLPLIPIVVSRNEKKVHSRFEKVQECYGRISSLAHENLTGVKVVKTFVGEHAQIERMKELGEEFVRLNLSLARIQTSLGPTLDLLMSAGMVLLLAVGGGMLIKQGSSLGPEATATGAISLGTFVAFQRYIQKMVWPMTAVGMAVNYYQRSVTSSHRLKAIFAIEPDAPAAHEASLASAPKIRKLSGAASRGKIEFRGLSFSYPGCSSLALQNIRLTVDPGERVALVGGVGSGKTTLLSLLPRLYSVPSGLLFIDDRDINEWPLEELRELVGYVGQEVFLFRDTVYENLALGHPPGAARYGEVQTAAQIANVHQEILGLAQGYDTKLSERGMNLSGGQRQRATLARALAKEPSILILDDAFSSVDVKTENSILKSLRSRSKRNTELIAAHRLSLVQDADRIVVLAQGKILEEGTHLSLVKAGGEYARMFEKQALAESMCHSLNSLPGEGPGVSAPDEGSVVTL